MVVNYLADILPERRRLGFPFCLHCGNDYSLPAYFFWPRRCSRCNKSRSLRSWMVEGVFILFAAIFYFWPPLRINPYLAVLILVYLGVVTVIDLEHRLILHPVSMVGAVLALVVGIKLHGVGTTLFGGIAGAGVMLGLYLFAALLARTFKRWRSDDPDDEPLGFGDVMLSGVVGLFLGWPGIALGLVLTILIAGAVSLIIVVLMLTKGRYRATFSIPYGPFLVISTFILLFYGRYLTLILGI